MTRNIRILFALFFAFSIFGCKNDPVSNPPETGALTGTVQLFDGSGNPVKPLSGITVALSGAGKSVVTDDSGRWMMSDVSVGSYDNLLYAGAGFGNVKSFSVVVIAKDTLQAGLVTLSKPPIDAPDAQIFQISSTATDSIVGMNFFCQMPDPKQVLRTVVVSLSTDSAALLTNPPTVRWTYAAAMAGGVYDGLFTLMADSTINTNRDKLSHGTKLYASVGFASEGANYKSFSHYYDPVLKQEIYTSLGPQSNIISAVIP